MASDNQTISNPNYSGTLPTGLLETLAARGIPSGFTVFYAGRNTLAFDPQTMTSVKSFKVPGAAKALIYGYLRKPKAMRAYQNAQRLIEMGFGTPEPAAAVICRSRTGLLGHSYYVCRQLEGYTWLRGAEKLPFFADLAKAVAALMVDMHAKGVYMKDFTPGNVMFRRLPDGTFDLQLVDINRMDFDVHDFNTLAGNLGNVFETEEANALFAREYAALVADDPAAIEVLAREHFRRRRRLLERKSRLKKFITSCNSRYSVKT